MWITRWITLFPSKIDVHKSVENSKSYPPFFYTLWITWVIHKLSTGYPHPPVDNSCSLTVSSVFGWKKKLCSPKYCSIKLLFFVEKSTILCSKLSFPHYPQLIWSDYLFLYLLLFFYKHALLLYDLFFQNPPLFA